MGEYGSISPSSGLPGATASATGASRAPPQQHDRAGRARQHRGLGVVDVGQRRRASRSRTSTANGLAPARLSCRSAPHRRRRSRPAGQVVAADPLDRHHRARGQRPLGGREGGIRSADRPACAGEPQQRPAVGAGDRLRVEAAVGRDRGTRRRTRSHMAKRGHGGRRPVVRQAADDGEPGPAVGAVDERVPVTPVGRVEQLGEAALAGGDVRRNRGGGSGAARPRRRYEAVRRHSGVSGDSRPGALIAPAAAGLHVSAAGGIRRSRAAAPAPRGRPRPNRCRRTRLSPSSVAIRWTNGRKPTPEPTPVTVILVRTGGRRRHASHC